MDSVETHITLAQSQQSLIAEGIRALIEAFLSGRSQRTIDAYRSDIEDFKSFVGADSSEEAARLLLSSGAGAANGWALKYRTCLRERGLSPATTNRRLAALRSLVKLARVLGMVSWDLEVQNLKSQSYRDTSGPGRSAISLMIEELSRSSKPKAVRDLAILRLLADLGLRRGEVVSLDVEDIDLDQGVIWILGKGREEKEKLSLPEPTREALRNWIEVRGKHSEALFTNFDRAGKGYRLTGTSIYRLTRKLGSLFNLKVRPHGVRHSAITEAVKVAQKNGILIEEVLDFSRHKNLKTLMVYRDRERNVQGKLASLVADSF